MTPMAENPIVRVLPLRLLIVDDDPFLIALLADHYRELGVDVEVAADGKAALDAMEKRRPDMVLCDRRMPALSGAELLQEVRARDASWQRVAFVFLTGLTDHRDRFAMLELNPDGYLGKPIDFERADRELAAILENKRSATA